MRGGMHRLDQQTGPPRPLTRDLRHGWLAGVCAGMARTRGLPLGWLRSGFAIASLVGGLGLLAYGACWLIIPAEGDTSPAKGSRAVVLLAQCCAAVAGLVTVAAAAGIATVFGFGWFVLLTAAVALGGALLAWPRVGPAWALLPVTALVAPALALAAGHVRVDASAADRHISPRTTGAFPAGGYRSGLGHLFVDLRRTAFPRAGTVRLTIRAGVKRTLIALPHDRCVHLDLRWHVRPFAARLARLLDGTSFMLSPEIAAFGQPLFSSEGGFADRSLSDAPRTAPGPTLALDFESAGGGLVVRDFPADVDPERRPQWPGLPGAVEPKPDVGGLSRRERRRLVDAWRARARVQRREQRLISAAMPGPCSTEAAPR
jgi:phage shock protein PspC (stress-responsive transcriptional regulator)